jgi:putative two-component system response regulator
VIVSQASTMHDLGKIGIPDYILMKPGLLTTEEFEEMKNHTILGWRLLSGSQTPLLQTAARIARSHHEKWDGGGYPDGLQGGAIPPEARIVTVADVFDALRAQRCYKPEYPLDQCFEMIHTRSGEHFDPEVVEAFMTCRHELAGITVGLNDEAADCASDAA